MQLFHILDTVLLKLKCKAFTFQVQYLIHEILSHIKKIIMYALFASDLC